MPLLSTSLQHFHPATQYNPIRHLKRYDSSDSELKKEIPGGRLGQEFAQIRKAVAPVADAVRECHANGYRVIDGLLLYIQGR